MKLKWNKNEINKKTKPKIELAVRKMIIPESEQKYNDVKTRSNVGNIEEK